MSEPRSIGENDLHAYVDGALDEESRAEVASWLASRPEDRAKADAWIAQKDAMHVLYDGVLDEHLPTGLAARLAVPGGRQRLSWWQRAAAASVLLAVGFAAGWGLRGVETGGEAASANFVRQAVGAHLVFTRENRHAVEVRADKEERHLVRWLSKRLGRPMRPPPLQQAGFQLVGGRLIADRAGPAAQFMYQDAAKRRVTLYVRRGGEGADTAFRYVSEDGVAAFYWIDRPLSYAVIARMEREELLALARIVYGALGS